MNTTPTPAQHIAVGILQKPSGEVLITSRPPGKPMAGYWEFPGGKIEPGETIEQAMQRELHEELAITFDSSRPLITLNHRYVDKTVTLHVRLINTWSGEPSPQEQQAMAWETPSQLRHRKLLPADWPIVTALELPSHYWITPDPVDTQAWLSQLEHVLQSGIKLIQLRATNLNETEYKALAEKAIQQSHKYNAKVLLNANPELAIEVVADGVHLNTRRLVRLTQRPLP
ncbi:MAG TPA: Nudix family hydrolase, partial [Gammaproteobacteria bacterium]|nr:Nudix family hydrolase [Gammaproteobacteria bacterium]